MPRHGAIDLGDLASDERTRLASFASAERRRQFALGRLAARRLLSRPLELAPRAVPIRVEAGGALWVPAGFVSIAHGGRGLDALGIAVESARAVGVDAERIRPRHPGLARRILRPDESSVLEALEGDLASSLTLVWALKEAVLKGQRTGLRAGAQSVRLSVLAASETEGAALAESDVSGSWRLSFRRQGDLWLAVALVVED